MRKTFYFNVKKGKMDLIDRDAFQMVVSSMEGKSGELVIGDIGKNRSIAENNYFHGVIVKMISDHTGMFPEDVKEHLKRKFLTAEFQFNGRVYEYIRHTAGLKTDEFEDFCEKCRIYAAQEWKIYLPLPNEY